MKSKLIEVLPFLVLNSIICCTWYELISNQNNYNPSMKQISALVLTVINLVVYFWNYKAGIVVSGVVFLIATFSFITIDIEFKSYSFFINLGSHEISTPPINLLSFILLIFYCVANLTTLNEIYKWINKQF